MMTVGIFIPVYNGYKDLAEILPIIKKSKLIDKIIAIDSSSTDKSRQILIDNRIEVITIDQNEFDHGLTREKGRHLLKTDIVIMMTQDAFPQDEKVFEHLVKPIISGSASISYAHQLPRAGSNILESFPREYNYPTISHIRSIEDANIYGVYTFFCSNSCAAYLNSALDEIGGFPSVLTHEDFVTVAKLLSRGHKIAYVAEARVIHSHKFKLNEEFVRYFNAGVTHSQYGWIYEIVRGAEERGRQLSHELLKIVATKYPQLLIYTLALLTTKFIAFQIGKRYKYLPIWIRKNISRQPNYWMKGKQYY